MLKLLDAHKRRKGKQRTRRDVGSKRKQFGNSVSGRLRSALSRTAPRSDEVRSAWGHPSMVPRRSSDGDLPLFGDS